MLYVFGRGHNPSTSTFPYCTLRLCPGSQSLYKYITMLYFTSVPGSQCFYKYIAVLYFTSLLGVTIPLQVHHHTVLDVAARGHNPATSTSPSCTLCLILGSQSLCKYITMLYYTSLPRVTMLLQVHHHAVLYVSARGHNHSTSQSPYCTLRLCPGSQSFYKYTTILYFTSLSGVTIILQVCHHTSLYVSAWGHNHSRSTSYFTIRLCPGSQSLCKYITMLYFTCLLGVTIPLQVHHHAVLYVSAQGHNASTSSSPCCTLRPCPGSQSFYMYITILYFTSLPGFKILLQVHHHTSF